MPDPERLKLPRELLIVGAAVELGIFDALRAPLSPEALVDRLGAERRGVEIVCGALSGLGYLVEANGLLKDSGSVEIPIHLLGKWQEVIKTHSKNG